MVALAALIAVLSLQQMRWAEQPGAGVEPALPDSPILLVMPFANLGQGNEAALYAAGVTEEILTKLSRFKDLAVQGVKPAPSLPATADLRSIAPGPSASYLVTGSLRLSGPRDTRDQPARRQPRRHRIVGADL